MISCKVDSQLSSSCEGALTFSLSNLAFFFWGSWSWSTWNSPNLNGISVLLSLLPDINEIFLSPCWGLSSIGPVWLTWCIFLLNFNFSSYTLLVLSNIWKKSSFRIIKAVSGDMSLFFNRKICLNVSIDNCLIFTLVSHDKLIILKKIFFHISS